MLIYYDGYCGLCDRFVQFVLRRDRAARYRFAPLQGSTAQERVPATLDPRTSQTVILEEGDRFRVRSDAALAILSGLGGPWRLAGLLRVIPRPLRDAIYDLVARNRERWFGRRAECRVPQPDERDRFLP
ncbi:MAG TPA: DCC1-like thiol-disulfide oxidoreductase family protein [Gemmatimonadales bacterium]|nr:DCC1-like thiol-disulfide oxidoreductase family protein [Gemmatimonadales bacterium]